MAIRLKPLYDLVLVLPDAVEEQTASGLLIPEMARRTPNQGTVISVGEGHPLPSGGLNMLNVAVGDRVMFPPGAGFIVPWAGRDHVALREMEIMFILENVPDPPFEATPGSRASHALTETTPQEIIPADPLRTGWQVSHLEGTPVTIIAGDMVQTLSAGDLLEGRADWVGPVSAALRPDAVPEDAPVRPGATVEVIWQQKERSGPQLTEYVEPDTYMGDVMAPEAVRLDGVASAP